MKSIHISKSEQLRRFRQRTRTTYKQWKITAEDWRNRARWSDHVVAVNDMVAPTSTQVAPWTLVEGNDKNFARSRSFERWSTGWRIACAPDVADVCTRAPGSPDPCMR